jgi:hypothetical protein
VATARRGSEYVLAILEVTPAESDFLAGSPIHEARSLGARSIPQGGVLGVTRGMTSRFASNRQSATEKTREARGAAAKLAHPNPRTYVLDERNRVVDVSEQETLVGHSERAGDA